MAYGGDWNETVGKNSKVSPNPVQEQCRNICTRQPAPRPTCRNEMPFLGFLLNSATPSCHFSFIARLRLSASPPTGPPATPGVPALSPAAASAAVGAAAAASSSSEL
jgi:hypothetical protein